MDKVVIEQLRVETIIGVFEWERAVKQTLLLDMELATDIRRAAETDELQYALNYARVCARVEEYLALNHFQLLETLAEQVTQVVMNEFSVMGMRLKVRKTDAVIEAYSVGVDIVRGEFVK